MTLTGTAMQRYPTHPDRPVICHGRFFPGWLIYLPNGAIAIRTTFEGALKLADDYNRAIKEVLLCR